jgi:hypothetical protein
MFTCIKARFAVAKHAIPAFALIITAAFRSHEYFPVHVFANGKAIVANTLKANRLGWLAGFSHDRRNRNKVGLGRMHSSRNDSP